MGAERLKIVARNAQAMAHDDCVARAINLYDLDLSDEHMAHVYRFRGLEPFDRQDWKRWRGYCAWKSLNKRLMDEHDATLTAEQLEQRRQEVDDPNCWMCGGDGECERDNEEANFVETITCPECHGTGNAEGAL